MGERLTALVERWLQQDRQLIKPVRNDPAFRPHDQKVVELGYFFEHVTARLHGGTFRHQFAKGDSVTNPDIVNKKKKEFWESKAFRSGMHCILLERQMEGYFSLAADFPDWNIYFAFYRHSFFDVKSTTKDRSAIFAELAGGPLCSVVLPFSVLGTLYTLPGGHDFIRRYPGKNYEPVVCINSPVINRFIDAPHATLRAMDLDPDRYDIEQTRTSPMVVVEQWVKPFPVLRIREKPGLTYPLTREDISSDEQLPF